MHFLGLAGMPRRIPDYPDAYETLNNVASLGSFITTIGVILFFYIIYQAFVNIDTVVNNSDFFLDKKNCIFFYKKIIYIKLYFFYLKIKFIEEYKTLFLKFKDVIREGSFLGDHTFVVQRGLRYGMVLFITSEVMFFFAFF